MSIMRHALLWASRSPTMGRYVRSFRPTRAAVTRFMPGEELDDALRAGDRLRTEGHGVVLTRLGENITEAREADEVERHYLEVLDRVAASHGDIQISVKLTQLGLDLDAEQTLARASRIAARAKERGTIMWVDIEDSSYVDRTLALFHRLLDTHDDVGLCVQAYLYRTERDLAELLKRTSRIRLVKGAYNEPASVAWPKKPDVDENYRKLARMILGALRPGEAPAFGTHDERLVQAIRAQAGERGLAGGAYEVHMLYGIRPRLQQELIREGVRLRTLISYGSAWYPWFMRRLAERPANVLFVLRNVLPGADAPRS
jgi:proline dehydrogenase